MAAGKGKFHDDFRLSITKALGDQLAGALAHLGRAPLNVATLAQIDERAGVYQLYLDGKFIYVGKADRSLRERLAHHLLKLSGRRNIELEKITFSCLYVEEDFSALAPEQLLISHHKGMGEIPWNNNGFGNKDPGRQRDRTILKASHFDVTYPIDLNLEIEGLIPGDYPLNALLKLVKQNLPYTFRYKEPLRAKYNYLRIPDGDMTVDRVLRLISGAVPDTWQITALMGYVIMYDDAPTEYESAWRYYRAGVAIDTTPDVEVGGDIEADVEPLWHTQD
ncbi:hypothetical protein ACIBCD_22080 [Nocardia brasiliensis]|uniref:hypothetical protein n=1 Tax=Nocardia brasiliensis TaxID=37326 RepID=UPI0037BB8205